MMLSQFLCEAGLGPVGRVQGAAGAASWTCSSCGPDALPGGALTRLPAPLSSLPTAPPTPPGLLPQGPAAPRNLRASDSRVAPPGQVRRSRGPERLSGQPPSQSTGLAPLSAHQAGPPSLPLRLIPAAGGTGGKAGGAGDSCHPSSRPFPVAGLQGMK